MIRLKSQSPENSLAVQCLRLSSYTFTAMGLGSNLGGELRSHKLCSMAKGKKKKSQSPQQVACLLLPALVKLVTVLCQTKALRDLILNFEHLSDSFSFSVHKKGLLWLHPVALYGILPGVKLMAPGNFHVHLAPILKSDGLEITLVCSLLSALLNLLFSGDILKNTRQAGSEESLLISSSVSL